MVTNDMAWNGSHTTVDYSIFDVFNDPSEYHPYCHVSDYQNSTEATECWTGDDNVVLPDLALENSTVVNKWTTWVENIVTTYKIDGIRLDDCLEQNKGFFPPFETAAGVYIMCEVYNYPIDGVCDYQNYVTGLLNFPIWYKVIAAFSSTSGDMGNLSAGITSMQGSCKDVSLLGNFVENHDVNRLPCTVSDSGLDQNAIAFTMLNDGIPIIYAGQEQYYSGCSPPTDREPTWTSKYDTTNIYYQLIHRINLFRNCVIAKDPTYLTTNSQPFFLDTQVIGVKKGSTPATQVVGIFNNRGTNAIAYTINMTGTGYTAGQQVFEMYTNQTVTVTAEGYLPVYMYGGQPRIYYLLSSQCFGNTSTTSTTSASSSTSSSTSISSKTPSSTTTTSTPSSTPGSMTSSAVASVLPSSPTQLSSTSTTTSSSATGVFSVPTSLQIAPPSTSTSSSISGIPSSSSSSGIPSSNPASTPSSSIPIVTSGAPASSVPLSPSLLPTSPSTAHTPATTPPVCPSADGASFILNGKEYNVGCGIGSDQAYFAQLSGQNISDCATKCVTYTGAQACEAVTYIKGVCYFKSQPGAVHNEDGSDSAFITSTSNGQETLASSFLSGNISQAAPVCPNANGDTFESNGYVFVVGCNIDNYVIDIDISTSPGADLATCVESCTTFSGTVFCAAVTYNNGTCHFKASVGTTFHAAGADTAFIIASPPNINPAGIVPSRPPPGPSAPFPPPPPIGNPPFPPKPTGIPPQASGTYTIASPNENEVIVYMPLNETCP